MRITFSTVTILIVTIVFILANLYFFSLSKAQDAPIDIAVDTILFPDADLLPSQSIVYSLFITNNSDIAVSNIIVSDILPTEIVSTTVITTPNGSQIHSLDGYPNYRWQIDNLAAHSRVDIYIIGEVANHLTETISIENVFEAHSDDDGFPSNNQSLTQSTINVPELFFDDDSIFVTEASTSIEVMVKLDFVNPYGSASVDYALSGEYDGDTSESPRDLAFVRGSLDFGSSSFSGATIPIDIYDDFTDEGDETFYLTLSNPRGASLPDMNPLPIIIQDNDNAQVSVYPPQLSLVEGGMSERYIVALESEPTADVNVKMQAAAPLQATPSELRFTAQNWQTPQKVTVSALQEADEAGTYMRTVEHVLESKDPNYNGLQAPAFVAEIVDDESADPELPFPEMPYPGMPSVVPLHSMLNGTLTVTQSSNLNPVNYQITLENTDEIDLSDLTLTVIPTNVLGELVLIGDTADEWTCEPSLVCSTPIGSIGAGERLTLTMEYWWQDVPPCIPWEEARVLPEDFDPVNGPWTVEWEEPAIPLATVATRFESLGIPVVGQLSIRRHVCLVQSEQPTISVPGQAGQSTLLPMIINSEN